MTKKAKCKNCTDEMIEEMAEVMAKNWFNETIISTAERLYNAGYRKIPEGSVVLSNDEWARLRNLEINYDDAYEDYLKYEIENQQLKKQVKELEEQRDRQAYIAEELIQEKHRWTEQARKETAKEIFQEINHLIINDRATPIWVKEVLIKLAKAQFGVEVEE